MTMDGKDATASENGKWTGELGKGREYIWTVLLTAIMTGLGNSFTEMTRCSICCRIPGGRNPSVSFRYKTADPIDSEEVKRLVKTKPLPDRKQDDKKIT